MMAAIYYGAMYGGSTTAIVVNIPGEASSVPTAIDGFFMALAFASIARGIWLQVRSHSPEIAIDDADE